jgi:hypothetical protein
MVGVNFNMAFLEPLIFAEIVFETPRDSNMQ